MSSILLDFHNKLGDNIIVNGIVREYCKRYDRVGIFCIPHYRVSVSFMYRDLPNLHLEMVKNHRQKLYFRLWNAFRFGNRHWDEIKIIQNDNETGIVSERQLYALAGIPFEKKWSSFFVARDAAREDAFFSRVVPMEPYQFVHDDAIYGGSMSAVKLNPSLPIVRAEKDLTDNIFDYCAAIERAAEIHVVDSVFMYLVDCLPYTNPSQKLFVHRYARANPPWQLPILKKNWTILT